MGLTLRAIAALLLLSFSASAQSKPAAGKTEAPPLPAAAEVPLALPLPAAQPPLDLGQFLKDTSLCVFPFIKETGQGSSDRTYLDSIQKTFFEVAKESPLLKDAVLLTQTSACDPHDASCISLVGRGARCQNVLVGSSAAKGNGFVLSVRIFEVDRQRIMPGSEVEQVLETDRQSDVQAWAEGQACRALQVKCMGRIYVDADRKDMNVYIDNRLAPRSFKTPEQIAVEPGVHGVRIAIGQRTSLERKVTVRRNGFSELVYARQTERGGLPITLASDLRGGGKPAPSVDFQDGKWARPVGLTVAGAGLVVAGFGVYQGLHAKSLMNDSNAKYASQHAYLQSDLANIDSANSAAKTANILYVVGAVLFAAGLTTAIAF
jgi:hypothetical protein